MRLVRACLFLALLSLPAWAQQTGISGTVTDTSGGVLALAKATVSDRQTGTSLSTVTNPQGIYSFPSLLASDYTLRLEAVGFAPAERTFTLLVGQPLEVDVQLRPGAVTSTVDVLATAVEVDATSSQVAGQINPQQMRDVPLNGRNWMELALLLPGVVRNSISTGSATEAIGKYRINLDGQQVTQDTAGTGDQANFSREAIAQFQVVTNRFDATLGRSSNIQINAQTKSGSNALHGSLYAYFRNDMFNAADKVAKVVLPYQNQQYGGTIGGAIFKDKLFFFGAYEGSREPSTIFTTPVGFGGQSFTFGSQSDIKTTTMRFDYQFSSNDRFSLRLSDNSYTNPFTGVGGDTHPSRATTDTRYSKSALIGWSKIISPALVSDLKLGFVYHHWTNDPIVPSQEYRFNSTTIGGPYNYPGYRFQNTFQLRDDLYWLKGTHSFKFGAEFLNTRHYGIFQQNFRGVVTAFSSVPSNLSAIFPVWNDPSTWNLAALSPLATSFVQGFGKEDLNILRNSLGFWVQDDWKIKRRLTLNLGLRYDNDIGMIGDSPTLKSGLKTPHNGDNNNLAPRLGFAWDVTGQQKTVIRGGAGLYFADMQANQFYNQQLFNGETSIQASLDAKPGAPINLAAPFGATTGVDFVSGKVVAATQAVQLIDPGIITPYTYQASIGFEQALGKDWDLQADFVNWRLYHEWIRIDQNLFFDPATGYNLNPSKAGRPDARFTSIQRFYTPPQTGAIFTGLEISLRRRFSNGLSFSTAYTLSKNKDDGSGSFTPINNSFDFSGDWATGPNDQRHTPETSTAAIHGAMDCN